MENLISVTLTGPAKIGDKYRKAGEEVSVSADELRGLQEADAVPHDQDAVAAYVKGNGDLRAAVAQELTKRAVASAVAERDANWSTALDHFQSMALDEKDNAIADLRLDHQIELRKVEAREAEAIAEVTALRNRIAELEAGAKPDTTADPKASAAKKT